MTLTTRDQTHDRDEVARRCQRFVRRLVAAYPKVAYIVTWERHQSGAVHAHMAVSVFIPKDRLARLWGHGLTDIRKLRSRRAGARESARLVARYVAKYVTKAPIVRAGQHRYEVREGLQPEVVAVAGWSPDEAWRSAVAVMYGEVPSYEWSSSGDPDWLGPPTLFLSW